MTFADTFRDLAVPRLRPLVRTSAMMIAMDERTFTEGLSFILGAAVSLGAAHLPAGTFLQLQDWLQSQLLIAIDRLEKQEGWRLAA